MQEKITIVVAIRNEAQYIGRCLDSLINQNFPKEKYRIAVADGQSIDGSLEIVKGYKKRNPDLIDIHINKNEWQASGRNIVIKNYDTDLVAYVDGHCMTHPDWLKNLYISLTEICDDDVAGIGSILKSPNDESAFGKAVDCVFSSALGGMGTSYKPSNRRMKVNTAPFMLYKSKALKEVGLYDEDMKYGEDFSLNYKLRNAGYNLFVEPKAIVYYYKRKNIKTFIKQMYNYGYTKSITFKKYKSSLSLIHFIPSFSLIFLMLIILINIYTYNYVLFFFVISLYVITIVFNSIFYSLSKNSLDLVFLMPIIYICEHLAYGVGFIVGLSRNGWQR